MANPKTALVPDPPLNERYGWTRKSDHDAATGSILPIPTQVVSNEEFVPLPQTSRQRAVEHRLAGLTASNAAHLGISRRDYLRSTAGMAAAFTAMNAVFGSFFRVEAQELKRQPAAARVPYFIFDVQTHHVKAGHSSPLLMRWRREAGDLNPALAVRDPRPDDLYLLNYIKEVFLDSETSVALISGVPTEMMDSNILPPDQMVRTHGWINELARSQRMVSHGLMSPEMGEQNLEAMQVQAEKLKIDAWKGYTGLWRSTNSRGWWLDDEKLTYPSLELSRKLGVKNICIHKGLSLGLFNEEHCHPRDLVKVSKDFPDLNFIVYHSGFRSLQSALAGNSVGIGKVPWTTDLCEMRRQNPHMTNVYLELGGTFGMTCITSPLLCCHILGQILNAFGDDRLLWGTDSIWWGSPQWQIEAMRRLEMPESLMKRYGYKPLTPAVKSKIFGLNAARLFNVDPKSKRNPIPADYIDRLRARYKEVAIGPSNTQYGWLPREGD